MVQASAIDSHPPAGVERLHAADGVGLACEFHGPADGPAVAFAHGFGQTRHAWQATARQLGARGWRTLIADGRGHGDSGWVADGDYRFEQFIDDTTHLAEAAGGRPAWVGASMGGLLGMVAESMAPSGRFAALVLVDITPRWEASGVERIIGFMRAHPQGFASVHEAQDAVRDYLPHRAHDKDPKRLSKLLVPMANGRLRWYLDPRLLETVAHEAQRWGPMLADAARALRLPVLLVSGGRSDVVSRHTIEEFLALAPHAEHAELADATHMVAGDANHRFTATIADFLHRIGHAPARGDH
jgi:pimeloyl-ACP methyl ester carboxylesterase